MGGSTADTPTTPEFLRVSDADRDHAVNELRSEFVDGRLSHETFVYRMQTALDARNRGQLAKLFTDLPPRRTRLLARIKAALFGAGRGSPDERAQENRPIPASYGVQGPRFGDPRQDQGFRRRLGAEGDADIALTLPDRLDQLTRKLSDLAFDLVQLDRLSDDPDKRASHNDRIRDPSHCLGMLGP